MYDEQSKSFYKDDVMYEVSVIDMLSPEVNVFTCGFNGFVRDYPTKKPIQLSGAQIKLLMSCNIPEEQTEVVDGVRIVRGHSEYPRFSITLRNYGQMPTEKATILGQTKVETIASPYSKKENIKSEETETKEEALTAEEIETMSEPVPDRRETLEAASRDELVRYGEELGVFVGPRTGKEAIIRNILKREAELAKEKK